MSWWEPFLEVGGSLLDTILGNEGADDATDEVRKGLEGQTKLAGDIYRDQRALSLPTYLTGGAATNKLGSMYNLAPQDYGAAARGSPGRWPSLPLRRERRQKARHRQSRR